MSRYLAIFGLVLLASGCGDGGPSNASSRSFLHDSSWPVPTADTWRSSTVSSGGLPEDARSEDLIAESVELGPIPFFAITYSDDTLFVLGGSPFLLELFTLAQGNTPPDRNLSTLLDLLENFAGNSAVEPYVAKIDTKTMTAQYLPLQKRVTPNYPGGIVAHQNGNVYAVATATLYEIDPDGFQILRSLELPRDATTPALTIYNSLQISTRNGDLFLKTSTQAPTGLLLSVDTESFEIRHMIEAELGTARLTTAMQGSTEYVYVPGLTQTLRFAVTDEGFEPDSAWSKTYRADDDGTTAGVAMLNMGSANAVIFPNNNTVVYGVTAPLELFSQSTTNDTELPQSVNATGTSAPGGSFTLCAGNPVANGIVVAQDAVNGRLAAWRVGEGGSFENLWMNEDLHVSLGAAVVVGTDRLYTDDRTCPDSSQTGCTVYLVVVDLSSGEELARVEVAATEPSLAHILVGRHEVYYVASEAGRDHGFVTKVSAR